MTPWDPTELVREYGTPLLVLSLPRFQQQLDALAVAWSAWPGAAPAFYLPMKTNDVVPFARTAAARGLGLDVTEAREVDLAVGRLGVAPAKVVVSGPAKSDHLLRRAVECGVRLHVDGLDELQALQEIATRLKRTAKLGLRLCLGEPSKFGFSPTDMELTQALDLIARSPELSLVAVHHHDAASLNSVDALRSTLLSLRAVRDRIARAIGERELEVNLGGGLRTGEDGEGFGGYRRFVTAFTAAAHDTGTHAWQFAFEWGRALFGPCGSVVARVVRRKDSVRHTWLYLDAGQNVAGGGHAGVGHHPVRVVRPAAGNGTLSPTTVAGPLCFRSDVIAEQLQLPPAQPGDLVVIGGAGAYTVNTRWHGPGKTPVVLLETDTGFHHLGRLPLTETDDDGVPHVLDDLFRLFFRDEFDLVTEHNHAGVACGISSGTNNLDPPPSLKGLLAQELAIGDVLKAYTGPYGSDEIAVAALAFEEAFAGDVQFQRNRCAVTIGAAQGCAAALRFLEQRGYDHSVIAGPQYPLVHDMLRRRRFGVTEVLGHFAAGCLPSGELVAEALRSMPRAVLFVTIPNNPTGTAPTEGWLRTVFEAVRDTGSHVLIDRSSEDLPLQPWVRVPPSTRLASTLLPVTAYTIVNSISKSRSVPGIRLGYLLGSVAMAKAVAEFNYSEYLSLPRAGTTLVAADMVLRALWWREVQNGNAPADAAQRLRDTVCRHDGPGLRPGDVEAFSRLRSAYVRDCEQRLATIKGAQQQFASELGDVWVAATPHHNGFNVVAEIATRETGRTFAAGLFRATGLRLLPTECFTFDGRPVATPRGGLGFRLSSADEPSRLRGAACALAGYVRQMSR
jgi:diaminopimelate decarboxylase